MSEEESIYILDSQQNSHNFPLLYFWVQKNEKGGKYVSKYVNLNMICILKQLDEKHNPLGFLYYKTGFVFNTSGI
jgi:hypothetical protein